MSCENFPSLWLLRFSIGFVVSSHFVTGNVQSSNIIDIKKEKCLYIDASFTCFGPDVEHSCTVMRTVTCPRCINTDPLQQRKSEYCQGLMPHAGLAENALKKMAWSYKTDVYISWWEEINIAITPVATVLCCVDQKYARCTNSQTHKGNIGIHVRIGILFCISCFISLSVLSPDWCGFRFLLLWLPLFVSPVHPVYLYPASAPCLCQVVFVTHM